jgi:catechol 2,3-dioxygenase-like lactoylglutathione lyase family enzyme
VANGVGQVGILVRDLDQALRTYGAVRAVESWSLYTYGPEFVPRLEYRGQAGRFSMRIALGGKSPQVELLEPLDGPSIYHEWIAQHGFGLHHLGFYVESLEVAIRAMSDAGFPVLQMGTGYGADGDGGFAYFDTLAEASVIFEAIEVPARRKPPQRIWQPGQPARSGRLDPRPKAWELAGALGFEP